MSVVVDSGATNVSARRTRRTGGEEINAAFLLPRAPWQTLSSDSSRPSRNIDQIGAVKPEVQARGRRLAADWHLCSGRADRRSVLATSGRCSRAILPVLKIDEFLLKARRQPFLKA